jgi:Family of unknown function (DUF5712)
MMTKIGSGSSGSCEGLVEYLEKEQAGLWFGRNQALLAGHEVVADIDRNKRNLGRDDAKYYQVILAPSQAELAHIGSDPQRLQAFTRTAMEQYAANFGKGISSSDLVWFAKIEHSRHFTHADRTVQVGEQPKGVAKTGDQTHIHVIVSRTENLRTYADGKKNELHQRKNPYHLSPLTNHKATTKGPVVGGFERNQFSQRTEQTFDQTFGYDRALTESFRFLHCMKYGDEQAKGEMQREAAAQVVRAEHHRHAQKLENEQMVSMYQQSDKTPESEPMGDLRAGLSKAYQQKDVADLRTALTTAQGKRKQERPVQEQKADADEIAASTPALNKGHQQPLADDPLARQQAVADQQKIEQKPKNPPRISRGLGR